MFELSRKNSIALAVVTVFLLSSGSDEEHGQHSALTQFPQKVAWAWERPEDLTWLPNDAAVAYVASAITLEGDQIKVRPRAFPLKVRSDTLVIPVVHVDASLRLPPSLSVRQRDLIAEQLLKFADQTQSPMVQLDFEARRSQRAFLQDVVATVRRSLPQRQALSMTALASWCAGDFWLADLQADEIVPMAFRMAKDEESIRNLLASKKAFPKRRCQNAIGFATDEPKVDVSAARRYFFSPVAWTEQSWKTFTQ